MSEDALARGDPSRDPPDYNARIRVWFYEVINNAMVQGRITDRQYDRYCDFMARWERDDQ